MSVLRRTIGTLALSGAVAMAPTGSAFAAGATALDGLLTPDTNAACANPTGSPYVAVVTGTLQGCWYGDTFVVEHANAEGALRASGTEHFVGCLANRCGTFFTVFTFTAQYAGDLERHGRCHHPIVGGTDGFAGATGVIDMHDLPNGCATYRGTISFR